MKRFFCTLRFLSFLCCVTATTAIASRAFVPMGANVRQAVVVALADTVTELSHGRHTTLTLREIIKGDAKLVQQQISLPTRFLSADVGIPRDARGIAVLLPENWKTGDQPVLEVYQLPEEIAALRVFVAIYELPSERARLLALRDRMGDANPLFGKQLFYDLAQMREADNFSILIDLFGNDDEAIQRQVIELIGTIGDNRGVPTLIAALDSPHRWVAVEAARALRFTFPGAPGVTAAFRRARQNTFLQSTAESYLMAYDAPLAAEIEAKRNPYQRVSELLQGGDEAGALPFFDLILSDPEQTESMIRFHADWVVRTLEQRSGDQEAIAHALLPVLTRLARDGDYLQAASAAKVLSALHHSDRVPPLLGLLSKAENSLFDQSTRMAAFALADQDAESRQQVVIRLSARKDWAALRPVFDESADEGLALTAMLEEALSKGASDGATDWMIYRLGALREKRAIALLVRHLTERPWSDAYTTTESLIHIGGLQVEEAALQLLKHPDETGVRRQATEMIFRLQGKRALPLARRLITENGFGDKSSAALYLGRHGTPDDLEFLIPLSDFWAGDRANHYWLMSAISQIRIRHHFDLNGPIKEW